MCAPLSIPRQKAGVPGLKIQYYRTVVSTYTDKFLTNFKFLKCRLSKVKGQDTGDPIETAASA